MALFKILKGQQARLPNTSKQGYAYYTTDKGKFYIFNSETQRRTLNPDIKITIGNQTKTSTTLSPEVAFDLASIGAAAADHNHDNRYLKLSGGTMTGTITLLRNQYADNYSGALNANNSNIYGVNSIYTADLADTSAEGIHFYRTSTTVDSLWIKNGVIYFTPNRTLGKTGIDYTIIHSGNYTDYTVKKDGTGATGNWNININKNAATATKLQTPRSLWGNSFDGSSDISGNITLKDGDQLNMQGEGDGFAFNYWDGKTTPQSTRFYDGQANQIVRFASNGNVGIGTSNPTSKLQINGDSLFQGETVTRIVRPEETKKYSLGTDDYKWAKVYIGTADTYGSTTKGVYWNAGVPTAMTYELKSTVNNGTATRIAYYSGTNAVSSGSIVTDGSYLHDVSSLYVTKNDWKFALGHDYTNQDAYLSAYAGGIEIAFKTANEGQTKIWIRPDFIYIGKKESDGGFHSTITTDNASGSITANGSLWISQNSDTGGGIHLADDGGFYDFNNGWGTAAFTSGLKIARGKDQNNTAIELWANGQLWAASKVAVNAGLGFAEEVSIQAYNSHNGRNLYMFNNVDGRMGLYCQLGDSGLVFCHANQSNYTQMWCHAYHTLSDIRLKRNIQNLNQKQNISFIRLLNPVEFQFKQTNKYSFGFIAQDVLKIMNKFNLNDKYNLVEKTLQDPSHPNVKRYYSINYTELIAPTIKAVQYLDKQIEQNKQKEKELQQQILKLKSQIQLLNAKLDTLVVSHL